MMTSPEESRARPWYIVMEAWHPFPHFGLDGLPWPLDASEPVARRVEDAMCPLPVAPGGCLFEGCFDGGAARAYFDEVARRIDHVYLVEIRTLDAPDSEVDGFDMGRPNGGFSVIGQEICKTEDGHRQFGHLLNALGLFPSKETARAYLASRAARTDAADLEHLDESITLSLRVLARGGAAARAISA
ncbi:hypothetical protein WME91_30695 [Sorangium sp. So ce269]